LWYLDDGNILLPLDLVPEILDILSSPDTINSGLHLNLDKSCLFSTKWEDLIQRNALETIDGKEFLFFNSFRIPIERSGVRLLGIPLGCDSFVKSFLDNRLNVELRSLIEVIKSIGDLHVSFYLWKYCAGFCKIYVALF
jgi:hypothetical protein